MSSQRIVRLRGTAPELVWPESLGAAIVEVTRLRQRARPFTRYEMSQAKGECLQQFADAQPNWSRAKSDRDPMVLLPRGWSQGRQKESIKYSHVISWRDYKRRLWRPSDDVFEHPDWFL